MQKRFSIIHLGFLIILGALTLASFRAAGASDGLLRVHFLDIGQGDAVFIQAPNGNQVLIDGGPADSILQKLGQVMPLGDRSIDLVVASHPHSDHISGLIQVLERYDVGTVIQANEAYDSAEYRAWQSAVESEGAIREEALAGKIFDLGNGATLNILYPFRSGTGVTPKNVHDYVVVAMFKYGETSVLLTGDMEDEVERKLILNDIQVDADVLKVGHHGSKTSTSEEFLSAVSPQVAIIQVGAENRYKHPSPEVLARLENYGITYYRNDTDGDITLVSDGKTIAISTSK